VLVDYLPQRTELVASAAMSRRGARRQGSGESPGGDEEAARMKAQKAAALEGLLGAHGVNVVTRDDLLTTVRETRKRVHRIKPSGLSTARLNLSALGARCMCTTLSVGPGQCSSCQVGDVHYLMCTSPASREH
jgi:hypothetical protein